MRQPVDVSVQVPPIRPRATSRSHRPPATVVALMALFGLLTAGALQGGIAMVVDPLTPLGMPTSFLDRAPIDTYLWPGLFLLGVAAASALTVAGLTLKWPWRWARAIENAVGYRWPWIAAITTGSVLLTFEIIELFVVPFHPVMHPLLIAGSLAIVALALAPSARSHLRVEAIGPKRPGITRRGDSRSQSLPARLLPTVLATAGGVIALVVGVGVGIRHWTVEGLSWRSGAGLVVLVGGLGLVILALRRLRLSTGPVRRLLVSTAFCVAVAVAVWTLTPAVIATFVPPIPPGIETPADYGMTAESATYVARDGVELFGWFVPSKSGSAVILRHGSGSTGASVLAHAAMLSRNGYSVLITDARGHGRSGGRGMDFGWFGDVDIEAAVSYLVGRSEVDPDRIAVLGMSMGGEEALGAAAYDPRIAAVVAEGATARRAEDKAWYADVYGIRGRLQLGLERVQFGLTDLLTTAPKPLVLGEAARLAATPTLLIAAGDRPDEVRAAEFIQGHSPATVETWTVPGATHTGGLVTAPAEWERKVMSFLDIALSAPG